MSRSPSRIHLVSSQSASLSDWRAEGVRLGQTAKNIGMAIGKWWCEGRAWDRERTAFVLSDQWLGPDINTVRNYASLWRKFGEVSERYESLGVGHFAAVTGLPKTSAVELLEQSQRSKWSVNRLRTTAAQLSRQYVETSTTDDLLSIDELLNGRTKFRTVYADPPWQVSHTSVERVMARHYDTMSLDALCAMPIAQIADQSAHLHLWVTNVHLQEAFTLMEAWGFTYSGSNLVWIKPSIGGGNYWRGQHEIMLLGVRSKARQFPDRSLPSVIHAPRGDHSEKPIAVRQLIEKASPAPRLELFGRAPVQGWTVHGNQLRHAREL